MSPRRRGWNRASALGETASRSNSFQKIGNCAILLSGMLKGADRAGGQAVKPGSGQEKTQSRAFRLQPPDIKRNRQGKSLEKFGNPRNFLGISLERFGKGLKRFGNLRRGEGSCVPVRR
jgi:hypothetical protein